MPTAFNRSIDRSAMHSMRSVHAAGHQVFLALFGDGLVERLGDEIDRIEEVVLEHIPEARHVDIEVL